MNLDHRVDLPSHVGHNDDQQHQSQENEIAQMRRQIAALTEMAQRLHPLSVRSDEFWRFSKL